MIILVVWVGLLWAGMATADWLPEVNLTNDTEFDKYTSYNNAWCVAVDTAGRVSVVWEDERAGWHIYYKERTDAIWSDDTLLVEAGSLNPSVAADLLGNIHVVWQDGRDPGWGEIYYKERTGSGWSADVRLTDDTLMSEYPSVAVDVSGNVHVVWQDWRDGNWEIYYKMRDSTSWQPDERLTVDSARSWHPCIATSPSDTVHVVWSYQDDITQTYKIYYKFKAEGSWSADTCISEGDSTSALPCVATDWSGNLHVVWHDNRNGYWEIYYKEKTPSGWLPDTSIVQVGSPGWPNIACDSLGNIHVVWMDTRDGYWRVYYKMRDTLDVWSADFPVSADWYPWEGVAQNTSVTADKYGNVHVVWCVDYWDSAGMLDGGDIFYREKRVYPGVEETADVRCEMPDIRLLQNLPNPFSRMTDISYQIPMTNDQIPNRVSLEIYDVSGRLIKSLVDDDVESGLHIVRWDGRDGKGRQVASGAYFCVLGVGEYRKAKKMELIK